MDFNKLAIYIYGYCKGISGRLFGTFIADSHSECRALKLVFIKCEKKVCSSGAFICSYPVRGSSRVGGIQRRDFDIEIAGITSIKHRFLPYGPVFREHNDT